MRDLVNCDAARTKIQTVGYEKSDLAQYIERLVAAGVEVLVDVRDRPISRKKGFSKKSLSAAVEAAGIQYMHVQALGDPKPGRDAARAGDYEAFVSIFTSHLHSDRAQAALVELAADIGGKNVCLTCFERDHRCCHRSIVADELAEMTGGLIEHLSV